MAKKTSTPTRPSEVPAEPRLGVAGERVGVRDEHERGGREAQHVEAVVARRPTALRDRAGSPGMRASARC